MDLRNRQMFVDKESLQKTRANCHNVAILIMVMFVQLCLFNYTGICLNGVVLRSSSWDHVPKHSI